MQRYDARLCECGFGLLCCASGSALVITLICYIVLV
jgi:hypothetical protein